MLTYVQRITNGRVDSININNYDDLWLFNERRNMKKLITIIILTLLLSSCGLRFGDYHRWQEVYGDEEIKDNDERNRSNAKPMDTK